MTLAGNNAPGLNFVEVSPEVTWTASTTVNIVTFPANSRTAADRPTSATYDTDDPLATFAGSVEFRGYLTLITGPGLRLELGDFSLLRDPARAGSLGGLASGWLLRNNRPGFTAAAFDLQTPGSVVGSSTAFSFSAGLLVSPELAATLQGTTQELPAGFAAGNFQLAATAQPAAGPNPIPLPPALYVGLLTLAGLSACGAVRTRIRPSRAR